MAASRRQFLTYLGVGSYATLMAVRPSGSADFPGRRKTGPAPAFFEPIRPSSADKLELPHGYKHDIIIRWNDPLGTTNKDYGPELFGFNCDFTAYFPIDALTGGKDS